jgi:ubiquinone/menaquinone biosynthesis C-methylase UbiE
VDRSWIKRLYAEPGVGDVNLRSGAQMREYETIVKRIVSDRPGALLDWGCGWGQVTALLCDAGIDTTAFDHDESVKRDGWYRIEKYPALERYLSSDPVGLPFPDGSFSAVLSCGVLEHVSNPDGSVRELHRVIEPGGKLYVYKLPNRRSYLEWIARKSGRLYYHGTRPYDVLYTLLSARTLLERHGFQVLDARLANMLPLTGGIRLGRHAVDAIWRTNTMLARVPAINRLATNIEVVAQRGTRSTAASCEQP